MDVFDLVAKISLDSSEYDSGMEKASKNTESFGSKISGGIKTAAKAGAVALTAASAAAGVFVKSSVEAGMEFDKNMAQVAATSGKSMEELAQDVGTVDTSFGTFTGNLREYAQFMGSKTAFSASQAAEALNYMALAGYNTKQSMQALPNVLNLAATGSMGLGEASDMVTDAQSALGLSMEETTQMVDQMAKASSKSNTSVGQLGEAILTIGATARSVQGGTVELSTVLGVLADNGIKGAEGGTHLRNIMLALQTPTKDGTEALEKLGMTYADMYDEAGNLRSLPEIFLQLQGSMEGMTQQSKDAIISGIFNKTDLAAVNALVGTSSERFDELSTSIMDSKNAAADMAAIQLDNLEGDITLFKSALEGAQIALSDQLTPSIREFVQFGTQGVERLTNAFKEDGLTGAMSVLGELISEAIGKFIDNLPNIVDAGAQLLGALVQGIVDNIPKLIGAAEEIGAMILSYDWAGLGTDIYDFILYAFTGISTWLNETYQKVVDWVLNFDWAGLGTDILDLIESAIQDVVTWATGLFTEVAETIKGIDWEEVGTKVWDLITFPFTTIAGWFTQKFTESEEGIEGLGWGELGTAIFDAITSAFEASVEFFTTIFNNVLDAIQTIDWATLGETIWSLIQTAFSTVVDWYKELFEQAASAIDSIDWVSVGEIIWTLISGAFSTVIGWFFDLFTDAGNGVKNNIDWAGLGTAIFDYIKSAFDAIVGVFTGIFSNVFDAVRDDINWTGLGDKILTFITDAIKGIVGWATKKFTEVSDAIKDVEWAQVGNAIVDFIKTAFDGIVGWFTGIFENVKSGIGDDVDWAGLGAAILDLIKSAFDAAAELFTTIFNGVKDAIGDIQWLQLGMAIWDGIISAFSEAVDWAIELFDNIKTEISNIDWVGLGQSVWDGIVDAFLDAVNWFWELFTGAKDSVLNDIDWLGLGESILGFIGEAFAGIAGFFWGIFEEGANSLLDWGFWYNIGSSIFSFISQGIDQVLGYAQRIIDTIMSMVNSAKQAIEGAIGRANDLHNRTVSANQTTGYMTNPFQNLFFAKGGTLHNGDVGIVGEAGAELLEMHGGTATITPFNGNPLGRIGEQNFTFNIYTQPGQDEEEIARQVQKQFVEWERERRAAMAS